MSLDELTSILARNSDRREDNETQFETGNEAEMEIKFSSETIYVDDGTFTLTRQNTYDSFVLGKSILGESLTYTTTADWNLGAVTGDCQVGTNQIELSGLATTGTWTSPTLYNSNSSNYWGIENFEGTTGNTIAVSGTSGGDYGAVSTTQVFNATYSYKFGDSTWAATETVILTVTIATAKDATLYDKLHFRIFKPTANTGTATWVCEINDSVGGWQAVTLDQTFNSITADTWTDVEGTLTGLTKGAVVGFRLTLTKTEAGTGDRFAYIDLLQFEDETPSNDFRALTATYSAPAGSTITVTVLNSADDSVLVAAQSIAASIDLSTYSALANKDIKLKFTLTSTSGAPNVQDFTLNWKADQLGDWSGNWETLETTTLAGEFTNTGRNILCDLLNGDAAVAPTHSGWGTGSIAATVGDTALGTEVSTREALVSATRSTLTITYIAQASNSYCNGYTLRELGLFNASSSGTMFERIVLSTGYSKIANYQFRGTVTVTVSA